MRSVVPALCLILLAGCTEPTQDAAEAEPLSVASTEPAADPVEPIELSTPIDWTDRLVRGAWACTQVGCQFVPSQEVYDLSSEVPLAPGNVTAGGIALSWDPVSPVTEELALGFLIHDPTCDECEGRYGTEVSGGPPLELAFTPDMVVEEGEVLRMWIYGTMIEGEPTSGTYVGFSDDQPFAVAGELVVQQ